MSYNVTIAECSKDLTARERLSIKDTGNAVKLDAATAEADVIIAPDYFAALNILNDRAEDEEYENYVVVDKDGTKYVTGSRSFYESFREIFDEMQNEDEEYTIKVYRMESKNYKGKSFITCSIM